jgi:hypothetical protein
MPITSNNVEKALNDFRDLMKLCFIDQNRFTDTEVNIGSGIKIPPKIQKGSDQITSSNLNADLNIYDSRHIDKISQPTYNSIKINVTCPINTYIPYNKYTLQDIRNAINSNSNVRSTYREYLSYLIYHYIQLIILSAIAIKIYDYYSVHKNKKIYKSYITYIIYYISIVRDIDTTLLIQNYLSNKSKVSDSSSSFVEQKTYNKKIINEIKDNERHLDYLYLYIYFIITLLIVIILFCILFKNKNNYLVAILVLLILVNAYFSKYVVLIEGFSTDIDLANNDCLYSDTIKFHLCQALNVAYQRFKSSRLPIIRSVSTQLIVEHKLYTGLYNKAKNINLNTKDKINIDTFSFYRRKAYTNLFMRIVILAVLLLILYNIFGYNYIIVILGIVLFCLILMVYFYTLKHISRTNYRTKNWI